MSDAALLQLCLLLGVFVPLASFVFLALFGTKLPSQRSRSAAPAADNHGSHDAHHPTTPSLGVPVSFAEISAVSALVEVVAMRDDLVPDVSLGTHFFAELVEKDMLYLAVFPGQPDNLVNDAFIIQGNKYRTSGLPPPSILLGTQIKSSRSVV